MHRLTNVYYNYTGSLDPITWPQNADVTYTYTGGSSLKATMTDASGTSSYGYDSQDRLTSYTPPQPNGHAAVTYGYNNLGQKTGISTTNYSVTYDYYANGWLKEIKKSGNSIAAYEYDDAGNRTEALFGNSTKQTYDYDTDPRYRLDEIDYWYKCDSESEITNNGGLNITRDSSGNPLTWGDQDGDYTKVYTYDLNSRLSSENYPGQGQTSNTYDWVGNKNPGTWTYNAADQLTSDGTHSYGYDYNGNQTTVDSTSTYTYTYTNLLSAKVGGTSMLWDAEGNRVRFTSSTDQSYPYYFVYDTTAGIPAVIEEVHDGSSVFYVREPGGALICRIDGATTNYYGFDELGNTLFLTASNGTVSDKYTYDAWGNVTSHTGSTSQPYQFVGGLGYYTHYQDSNMGGLLQLGVRYYEPETGRFTQRDPIVSDLYNAYCYSENSPLLKADPSGRVVVAPIIIMACVAAWCGDCMIQQKDKGEEADKRYWDENGQGERLFPGNDEANAVKHCVWACEGERKCGRTCATVVTSGWEFKNGRWWNQPDSVMDLHNNKQGISCGDSNGSCYDCCVKKLRNGDLRYIH